jgi:hypothetical protein
MLEFVSQNTFWFLISSLVLGIISIVLILILVIRVSLINRKNKLLFSGKDGKSLESVILSQAEELKEVDKEIQELFEISNKINNLALHSLHKVGVVRYNPFKDLGGDQSFAIALLDGKNSGLVISSLHTREGTRVYTKPVIKGESKKYPLTEEEKQAIKIASPFKEGKV